MRARICTDNTREQFFVSRVRARVYAQFETLSTARFSRVRRGITDLPTEPLDKNDKQRGAKGGVSRFTYPANPLPLVVRLSGTNSTLIWRTRQENGDEVVRESPPSPPSGLVSSRELHHGTTLALTPSPRETGEGGGKGIDKEKSNSINAALFQLRIVRRFRVHLLARGYR